MNTCVRRGSGRTPRPASSIQEWHSPVRNLNWLATVVGPS
jgi:hypothetical protein